MYSAICSPLLRRSMLWRAQFHGDSTGKLACVPLERRCDMEMTWRCVEGAFPLPAEKKETPLCGLYFRSLSSTYRMNGGVTTRGGGPDDCVRIAPLFAVLCIGCSRGEFDVCILCVVKMNRWSGSPTMKACGEKGGHLPCRWHETKKAGGEGLRLCIVSPRRKRKLRQSREDGDVRMGKKMAGRGRGGGDIRMCLCVDGGDVGMTVMIRNSRVSLCELCSWRAAVSTTHDSDDDFPRLQFFA